MQASCICPRRLRCEIAFAQRLHRIDAQFPEPFAASCIFRVRRGYINTILRSPMSVRDQYLTTAEEWVRDESDGVTRHYENLDASKRGVFLGLLLIILSCVAILVGMLVGNLMTYGM
jgi:hypothetical protein